MGKRKGAVVAGARTASRLRVGCRGLRGGRGRVGLESDDAAVHFWVQDTGPGIDPQDLPHLFTKFYRGTPGKRRELTPGSGLGLSIAQKAARTLDGAITVRSALGRGSIFTATFPKATSKTRAS